MIKQLISIVGVIAVLVVVDWLFLSGAADPSPATESFEPTEMTEETKQSAGGESELTQSISSTTASIDVETVSLTGWFIGLEDSAMIDRKMHQFMLLDDGTEIVRIDLRPLIGYKNNDVESALGVVRGDRVVVSGALTENNFSVSTIAPAAADL